jgi:hypothetical protein
VYQDFSKKLIRKLVTEKSQLPDLKNWYLNLPEPPFDDVDLENIRSDARVVNLLNSIIDSRIDNFMSEVKHYHHTINFEDIWNQPELLVNKLCQILKISSYDEQVMLFVKEYVEINNKEYFVK